MYVTNDVFIDLHPILQHSRSQKHDLYCTKVTCFGF